MIDKRKSELPYNVSKNESLNEKFEFVTNSSESFINISKSPQDKRIQILNLLKQ